VLGGGAILRSGPGQRPEYPLKFPSTASGRGLDPVSSTAASYRQGAGAY
jgi:hypothetical protein